MDREPGSFRAMMRLPSAYLPVAMSLAALTIVLGAVAVGLAHGGHIGAIRTKGPSRTSSSC